MREWIIRILLSPLALLYGMGVSLRDFFYSKKLLKGVEFSLPVIAVGNLSLGGAGKTPHVEYIVRLLKDYLNVGTLSRGYKRKTKGFRIARPTDNVEDIGDEPLQFLRKFPDIMVAVGESRMFAIPKMVSQHSGLQTVILDDAFQHRSVKPGLNILLTQYGRPFTRDWLMPAGRLREWRSAYRRADIIIVTKCPPSLTDEERKVWRDDIKPLPHQALYFSQYAYERPYRLFDKADTLDIDSGTSVFMLCALANADYLAEYLESQAGRVRRLEFADHHLFSNYDMARVERIFNDWEADRKIIITTEKDASRLELHKEFILQHQLPIYVLPAKVDFLGMDGEIFNEHIQRFLLDFRA